MELERRVVALESFVERVSDDLHEIRKDIKSFIEVKGKLDSIDALFKKIDGWGAKVQEIELTVKGLTSEHARCMQDRKQDADDYTGIERRVGKLEVDLGTLNTEHTNCQRLQKTGMDFILGRAGNIFDLLFKVAIIGGFAYMLMKGKGA